MNAFLFRYIIRYRLKTVTQNLKKSFPEKNDREIKTITSRFYKNLCDTIVESIKGYSLSIRQLKKRYIIKNIEVADKYYEKNQGIILALSHCGNWEWGSQIVGSVFKHYLYSFYKPLSNKHIDKYIYRQRTKRNLNLLSAYVPHIPGKLKETRPVGYFFISDQNPGGSKKVIWTKFLNQDTACFRGIEVFARQSGMPVIYFDVQRTKRGFYTVELEELVTDPYITAAGEITEKYMKKLESLIVGKPEDWLWSHRRWKLKKPAMILQ